MVRLGARSVALGLACMCANAACSNDGAGSIRDAGSADAGAPDAAKPPEISATATAQLDALAGAPEGRAGPVAGTARWRTTAAGVDLEISFGGCSGARPYPVEILEAADCSEASLEAPTWRDSRGDGVPGVLCTGPHAGRGMLSYARSARREGAWSIGGAAQSELVGHSLIVRDPNTAVPLACGVIVRGDDVMRVRLPAADEPPSTEVRAALAGLCLARQFPNSNATCPDEAALVECADVHCDLGSCVQTCGEYARCLDAESDVCGATSCLRSTECIECQNLASSCMLTYCQDHSGCAPGITPDGPCSKLEGCCALQGKDADTCLSTVQTLTNYGGDASCLGSMMDWDVLAHLHVPCRFEQ